MKKSFNNICRFSVFLATILCSYSNAFAGAENPRSVSSDGGARVSRSASRVISRSTQDSTRGSSVDSARTATQQKKVIVGRGAGASSVATKSGRNSSRQSVIGLTSRSAVSVPRSAKTAISRAAVRPFGSATNARSAKSISNTGLARAASTARATAIFNDISKIGGGYATCRESYATCMDQFCANANDTFRRCYCSERYTSFRETEEALDQAKVLLQQFEDNNLNAIDKTSAEVDAMYSATVGEAAIKTDVSGAQSLLNSIGDLLSGKKNNLDVSSNTSGSLGIMSLDFSTSVDDIWSGGGDTLFSDNSSSVNISALEGQALFNTSNKQCLQIMSDSCENQAVLNMATSAYGIMIAQDCNMYEKNVEKKREQVKQAVRQAEKVLRDARLEEYRAHNSADVNECLTKVRNAIKTDVACGPNYERCLDYSGVYVNMSTGEPIYSPRLFEMEGLITLDGGSDVLSQNSEFATFLDERKMFATSALDSCRDIADTVWTEFKRVALIEIAQAQDEKIEEVKMSCVSTMAECYDRQAGALKSFDTTESQVAGAISAYAARSMCADKVAACANLYGCNPASKDQNGNYSVPESCPLWAFVDAVDQVRVAEGCEDAVQKYVNDLCTPTSGDRGFPWNCRTLTATQTEDGRTRTSTGLEEMVQNYALDRCNDPANKVENYTGLPTETRRTVDKIIDDTMDQISYQLQEACEELDGYWYMSDYDSEIFGEEKLKPLGAFYSAVYGRSVDTENHNSGMGACIENTTMIRCLDYNSDFETPIATYDETNDECEFADEWYKKQCDMIGGYYEGSICYIPEQQ